ncbi:hypothetical protein [Aeromonas veronii]|uniref:hypothetical protein n=1 Tax=Aeromonas veronii TaxID=654 RepID=UPI00111792B0|nr:hypothetical protein [Aeromonas veronii]
MHSHPTTLTEKGLDDRNELFHKLSLLINLIDNAPFYQNEEHFNNIRKIFADIKSELLRQYENISEEINDEVLTLNDHIKALSDIFFESNYSKNKIQELNNVIDGRIKQLEKRQNTIMSDVDKAASKYQRDYLEYEKKLNITTNKRLSDIHDQITSIQIDTLEKITAKESELIIYTNKAQQDISNALQTVEKSIREATVTSIDAAKLTLSEIKNECLTEMHIGINNQIRIFANANNKLNRLLEVAGNGVLAKDNLKQAEQERKTANYLRNAGFICLLAAVLYIAIEIGALVSSNTEVTLEIVLIRLIITLVLMIPSAYLLKESARHRADERTFRKKGIHLATIDSYLSNFDDASKLDIKRQLTANFFDNNETVIDYSTVPDMNSSLIKLLETLVEKVKKEESAPQSASVK